LRKPFISKVHPAIKQQFKKVSTGRKQPENAANLSKKWLYAAQYLWVKNHREI
jgi:hypothetical protein